MLSHTCPVVSAANPPHVIARPLHSVTRPLHVITRPPDFITLHPAGKDTLGERGEMGCVEQETKAPWEYVLDGGMHAQFKGMAFIMHTKGPVTEAKMF